MDWDELRRLQRRYLRASIALHRAGKRTHAGVVVRQYGQCGLIDKEIAELVRSLWRLRLPTMYSCQAASGRFIKGTVLHFATSEARERFLKIYQPLMLDGWQIGTNVNGTTWWVTFPPAQIAQVTEYMRNLRVFSVCG